MINTHNCKEVFVKSIGYFNTARLRVRQLTSGDLDDLITLYQTPLVVKTLGGIQSRSHIIQSLENYLEHWDTYNFGYYIFEDKYAESFIGRGGLKRCNIDSKNEVEIGYALLPEYWGKGLATEIVKKLVDIGLRRLQLRSIVGIIEPDNQASQRVLEKNGFVFEKHIMHKGLPHDLYRLSVDKVRERLSNHNNS
jgi:ribosomal-protein-alanine N-acetyltransferase